MTAKQKDGNKTILVPLIIAGVIILVILAMGTDEHSSYAIPVDSFDFMQQDDNVMVRLDGAAREIVSREDGGRFFKLCSETKCIPMDVPKEIGTIFRAGDELVVTGVQKNHTIHVTQILRRCHGQEI